MPYKRNDSAIWWISYTDASGARIRRPSGTADYKEAKALEAKWRLEAHQQREWGAPAPVSFEALMTEFLTATATIKRSHEKDKQHARQLYQTFGSANMRMLSASHIQAHIDRRIAEGIGHASLNRELALLSAAINRHNRGQQDTLPNPVRGRMLPEAEGRVRWLTPEEAERLIRCAESEPKAGHLTDFLRLALHTGMRKEELLGLEWSRVNLTSRLLYLEASHTKTKKRRSIPLNESAYYAILARARFQAMHCPASPWVFCTLTGGRILDVKRSFATACRRAGIQDFRIHDLRHTCAAWLVSAGVQLDAVRDLLGHASITMTEKYAHLAPENVRRAVSVLDHAGHVSVTVTEKDRLIRGK